MKALLMAMALIFVSTAVFAEPIGENPGCAKKSNVDIWSQTAYQPIKATITNGATAAGDRQKQ